jgi:hypothetical protein
MHALESLGDKMQINSAKYCCIIYSLWEREVNNVERCEGALLFLFLSISLSLWWCSGAEIDSPRRRSRLAVADLQATRVN